MLRQMLPTRLQKKSGSEELEKTKAKSKKRTTQNALLYDAMTKTGICALPKDKYSSTMKFSDINYQASTDEDQLGIFTKYTEILNSLGNDTQLQLTVVNRIVDEEDFEKEILLKNKDDHVAEYRREYNRVLKRNILEGNNKIVSEKYMTYSVKEDSYEEARKSLRLLDKEFENKFSELGCDVHQVRGHERLQVIHAIMNPYKRFEFNYNQVEKGYTTKQAIAPDNLDFSNRYHFQIGGRYFKVLYMKNYSTELSDQLIQRLTALEHPLTINFHMKAMERGEDINFIKSRIAALEMDKMNEQGKNLKRGLDPDMISHELSYSLEETYETRDDVQKRNQRLFDCQFLVMFSGKNKDELDAVEKSIHTAAKRLSTELGELTFQQEEALNACLPIGRPIEGLARRFTTSVCAIVMPFTSQELMDTGESIYYGLNAITDNMIMGNRKSLKNPSGWIFGTPGSGKSFAVKREMLAVYLGTNDDLIIIDPEREYLLLTRALCGSSILIDNRNQVRLNAFDGDLNEPDFIERKAEFAQTFIAEVMCSGKASAGLDSTQKALVDRCVRLMYLKYNEKIREGNNGMVVHKPSLQDFYAVLKEQPETKAKEMVVALEMYVSGSYDLFSGQSNVDINNRMTTYDILDMGETLRPLSMLVILESLWNRIISNFKRGKRTWIWIDEIYLLFKTEFSSQFLMELFKRARKFGAIVTGITQNVEDLLNNDKARTMLSNAEFIMMLNQAASDREELASLLNISSQQLSYVTNAGKGCGLLKSGKAIIPFKDEFPKDTELYKFMTTDFAEKEKIKQGIPLEN